LDSKYEFRNVVFRNKHGYHAFVLDRNAWYDSLTEKDKQFIEDCRSDYCYDTVKINKKSKCIHNQLDGAICLFCDSGKFKNEKLIYKGCYKKDIDYDVYSQVLPKGIADICEEYYNCEDYYSLTEEHHFFVKYVDRL
jgi:hypothetical protein